MTERLNLASLLAPTSVQSFLDTYWARGPFLAKSPQAERFAGLLDLAEFEFLLSAVATPGWLSFVSGVVRPPSRAELTRDGTLDVAAIHRAVADNQSLLLTKVHRLHPATGNLCRRVTANFRTAGVVLRKPIRANAYFTPPRSQGFAPHYDDHDVLVLQLHGRKRWHIFGEAVKWPRTPMLDPLDADFLQSKAQEVTLDPGDVFYLPRGFAHAAEAQDTSSLHLTLSVQAATWADVFERLVALDERLGEPLPLGFCAGGVPQATDITSLARISGRIIQQRSGLNRAMVDIFNSTLAEGDLPPNGSLVRNDVQARVAPDMWFAAAEGISASLALEGGTAILQLPGAALRAEKSAAPLFRHLCDGTSFRLRDLETTANASLTELVQALLKRGVLSQVSPPDGQNMK